MKRSRWSAFLPAGLAWLAAALAALGWIDNPVLYLRGPLSTLLFLLGLILAGTAVAYLLLQTRLERRCRNRLAQAQTEAAAERRRFLRRLDHELKNPLTAMRAGLANLAEQSSPEERRQTLVSVETQTLRLSRLASDLRKLAELGTRTLERQPVNIADLLQEAVEVIGEQSETKGRQVSLTLPQAPWPIPAVEGDPDLLFLAVHNLLANALKFTEAGDTVEVRAFEDGTAVVIEVADTGPGIPQSELPHVWEELYRGHSVRAIPGSGLGLALVHAIVARHGGYATLRSRSGQGTVVAIRLPLG